MNRISDAAVSLLRGIAIGCLTGLFGLLLINVIARSFQFAGFAWFDEVVQGLFAWMVFSGAAALWADNGHFRVDWVAQIVPPNVARTLALTVILIEIGFLIAMTRYGWTLTMRSRALTPILDLPTGLFYAAIPFSGAMMLAWSIRDLLHTLHPNRL